eukprot:jgi/Pico_ML_1/50926/g2042.t1
MAGLRGFSSEEKAAGSLLRVPSSSLRRALAAHGLDARDCVDRQELVARAASSLPPDAVKQLLLDPRSAYLVRQDALAPEEARSVSLFARCAPSVVHIHTSASAPFAMDATQVPRGSGSGITWDRDGHVITNWHVLRGAERAKAAFADGRSLPARLVGQKVFAIGNPFGLDQTLTSGVVSGLGRDIRSVTGRTIRGVVQTDAAINPGNSGGPLLDSSGELVGVNTLIYSPSGAWAGVGFAIPSDTVARVVAQIIRHGHVARAALGVVAASDAQTRALRLRGVLALAVAPGSGAERAGVRDTRRDSTGRIVLGDTIVAVDGEEVHTVEDLVAKVEGHDVGEFISLTVVRGGDTIDLSVELMEKKE